MNIFEITLHKVPQALLHSLLRMHDALCRDWCLMLLWYKWPTLAECAQCVEMMPLSMLRISLQVLQEIGWCLSRVVFCTAGAAASSGGAAVAPEAGGAIPGGGSADPALVWGPAGRAAPLLRAQSLHSWAAARVSSHNIHMTRSSSSQKQCLKYSGVVTQDTGYLGISVSSNQRQFQMTALGQ